MYRSCHGKNSCLNKELQYGIQDTSNDSCKMTYIVVAYSYLISMKEFHAFENFRGQGTRQGRTGIVIEYY